ncbi:MAG: PSD1 and planctomycete cytochrome C domain-containing protein [Bacteroidota bacterium]
MDSRLLLSFAVCTLLVFCISCGPHLPPDVAEAYKNLPEEIDINFHVRPILSDRCFSCHGPDEKTREEDLRLDTKEDLYGLKKGDRRHPIIPGDVENSPVIWRILQEDPDNIMPPPDSKLSLTAEEKAILVKWVEQGAEWKPHWSFIPPQKAHLPKVQQQEWVHNPVDQYILARLEREGLSPSPEADKRTLIRRLSFDLRGLPPSPEEVEAFVQNPDPGAYENIVNQFLASSAYGERWCWEWLDIARYSDTNGFQGDPTRSMWPWRDWVIQAINDNMAYDRFTVLQLAGDLLPDASVDDILPTGFNRNHMYNGEGGRIPEETRVDNVFDRVETLGTVWLGLTVGCSRCHDHKFDPISQKEYYQFFDYFNQTSEEGIGYHGRVAPILDLSDSIQQAELAALQTWVDEKAQALSAHETHLFPHKEGESPADSPNANELSGDDLYALRIPPDRRNPYFLRLLREAHEDKDPVYVQKLNELSQAITKRDNEASQHIQVMVMDNIEEERPSFILTKGSYNQPETQVHRNVPEVLPPLPEGIDNNRLALAMWLVDREHPLTARVTVNRFWQSIFGTGLVKTSDDFGIQGQKPSHPQLLDWLAVEFMENGWDVKALHKQIVMSATYRQSSILRPGLREKDPDNRLLARAPRHRLPSWMIRDQALAISGLLVDSIGGPSVKPYQPPGIWEEATFGFKTYEQDHGSNLYRKTLYTFWRRIVGPTMLFDNAARQTCSVTPSRTNTPLHALTTLNDITYVEAARVLAERIMKAKVEDPERLSLAFHLATSRFPKTEEMNIMTQSLEKLRLAYQQTSAAEELLAVGEMPRDMNLNAGEHAAFTGVCSMILNLDETITKQ